MSQWMEVYETADPVPVKPFCTDAVGLVALSIADSSTVFLYSTNGMVKRRSQANTFRYKCWCDNIMI